MSYKSNVADYQLIYEAETPLALAIRASNESDVVWLPKSQIEFLDKHCIRGDKIWVTIPDWLAEKHDLA